MTIDKERLKDLAGQSALEPKWYAAGSHGLKAVSHLHDREFIAAASPATVLALLEEIERLTKFEDWFVRLDQVEQSLAASFKAERDQLKAENEDYKSGQERYEQIIEDLKAENEALRKDAERYRWLRKPWQEQRQVKAWTSLEVMDENIDAAMVKEASHG